MVAVSKETADLFERELGVLAQEVHCDVSSFRDGLSPTWAWEAGERGAALGYGSQWPGLSFCSLRPLGLAAADDVLAVTLPQLLLEEEPALTEGW